MASEHTAQAQLVARVRSFYPDAILAAVPNGGSRDIREAVKLKAEGVLPGFPDLILAEPRGEFHGMFLEMKREKGGRLDPRQKKMLHDLQERGYMAAVAYGVEEAWILVEEYLAL